MSVNLAKTTEETFAALLGQLDVCEPGVSWAAFVRQQAKKHLLDRNESCAVFVRNISLVVCHNYEDLPVSTSISALCLSEQYMRRLTSIPALFHTYQVLVYIKNSMWRVTCMGSSWYYDDDVGRFRSVIPDYPMTTPYTSQNLGLRNASLKMSGAEGVKACQMVDIMKMSLTQ